MKVLVVGSGGREHTLVWKLAQSPRVDRIYCAPGNGGISKLAECVDIRADDMESLVRLARETEIDLTVVGPEGPLVEGIVDRFEDAGLRVFGPRKNAAILEGSKQFTKDFLIRHGIPTAAYESFTDPEAAMAYIRRQGAPIVVKADGLAAGKGVIVAQQVDEAVAAVEEIMRDRRFGAAGDTVVVEACLVGEEASFMAFTDGKTVVPMLSSQDHKQVLDGDRGPNTGGMGAYTPAPVIQQRTAEIMETIMVPTVRGMADEGRPFTGVLYAGLMISPEGISVLEYNVRFGDPEAQPILFRLKSDLVDIIEAILADRLQECRIEWTEGASACVVLSSGGYPGAYETGKEITGLDAVPESEDLYVFHAGTQETNGKIVTAGGRVLGVTARGPNLASVLGRTYDAVNRIHFEGKHYRTDIGQKGLEREKE